MRRLTGLAALLTLALVGCRDDDITSAIPLTETFLAQVSSGPVVNSLADPGDGTCDDTQCTLREAIAFADPGATVTFMPGLTGTIALDGTGPLAVNQNLTIAGPGSGSLSVSGIGATMVFYIDYGVEAAISGVTVTNGYASSTDGGGIHNDGTLALTACVVSGNSSANWGGGIHNGGTLTITGCTVSDNSAQYGGGIENGGTLTLTESIVSGNSATEDGGGIYSYEALTAVRSTISGNTAASGAGGIYSDTDMAGPVVATILNTTISGNSAAYGGGYLNYDGLTRIVLTTITDNEAAEGGGLWSYNDDRTQTDVKGSIIWGNTLDDGTTAEDLAAYTTTIRFNSLGHNLVGAAGTNVDFTLEFNATGDQTEVADAGLGVLTSNGGPTETHALITGSPAIDQGTCTDHAGATVFTDQRSVSRPQGAACDIGAYESEESTDLDDPQFSFDLSGLGAKTYGDAAFSVAGYVSTVSSGATYFGMAAGSVGCSVTTAGLVTLTGAATGGDLCRLTAYIASDGTYASAGPVEQTFAIGQAALTGTADNETIVYGGVPSFGVTYAGWVGSDDESSLSGTAVYTFEGISPTSYGPSTTIPSVAGTYSITPSGRTAYDYAITWVPGTFTINKAAGSVSIANIPTDARLGGSFTPTYTKAGDGTASTASNTTAVCTVGVGGLVSFIAEGDCTLEASITEGTNHLSATGSPQTFRVAPETPTFAELMAEVEALGPAGSGALKKGQVNSLLVTLTTALKKLDKGQVHVAVNLLEQFIAEVQIFIDEGVLTDAQGQPLIEGASLLIASLS